MMERFDRWYTQHALVHEPDVGPLILNFYDLDQGGGDRIYPMLSGKAMLWLLVQDRVDEARWIAGALLRYQQQRRPGVSERTLGAFPSIIERRNGRWIAGDLYYAGDNLCILEALGALYERTRDPLLLERALATGRWVTEVMCQGHTFGALAEDHGAPIQFTSSSGTFSNRIYPNLEILWIGALKRLGRIANDPRYSHQADRAYDFLRRAQTPWGAFADHYDPGYPPRPYDPLRWKPYAFLAASSQLQVIADNGLRAALGACRMGDRGVADRFFRWLKVDRGGVPAYLDMESAAPAFVKGDAVYFDVVSSALHRSLCHWLGDAKTEHLDTTFLARLQDPNGGWFWGHRRDTDRPLTREQAPIIGFWATTDLAEALI